MPRRLAVLAALAFAAAPAHAAPARDWRLVSQFNEQGIAVSLYADAASRAPAGAGRRVDAVLATPHRDGGFVYALSTFEFDCKAGADAYRVRHIRVLDAKGAVLETRPDTTTLDRVRPASPEAALADFACRGARFPAARPGFPFR